MRVVAQAKASQPMVGPARLARRAWLAWLCCLPLSLVLACAAQSSSTPCDGGVSVGDMPAPAPNCVCDGTVNGGGAVVVRWRVADEPSGRLFERGQCCCDPTAQVPGCNVAPNDCPLSPGWLIPQVALVVTPVPGGGGAVSGSTAACAIRVPCVGAELTTNFCLAQGLYDLQLAAEVEGVNVQTDQFICPAQPAVVPPAVRRQVLTGQITNLDAVVLGVNTPQTPDLAMPVPDGGLPDGILDGSPADGKVGD